MDWRRYHRPPVTDHSDINSPQSGSNAAQAPFAGTRYLSHHSVGLRQFDLWPRYPYLEHLTAYVPPSSLNAHSRITRSTSISAYLAVLAERCIGSSYWELQEHIEQLCLHIKPDINGAIPEHEWLRSYGVASWPQSSTTIGTSRNAQPNNSTSPAPNSTNRHEAMRPPEKAVTPPNSPSRGGAIQLPKIIRVGQAEAAAAASVVGGTAETAETDLVALENEAMIER